MKLIDRLLQLASIWSATADRSPARLATVVVNDGKFFDRLAAGGSCDVRTFERFATHLSNPASWPGDQVPEKATELLTLPVLVAEPIADETTGSPSKSAALTGRPGVEAVPA